MNSMIIDWSNIMDIFNGIYYAQNDPKFDINP